MAAASWICRESLRVLVVCGVAVVCVEWEWRAVTGATQYRWRRKSTPPENPTAWEEPTGLSVTIDNLSSGETITVETEVVEFRRASSTWRHGDAQVADRLFNYGWSSADSAECTTTTGK